MSDVNQPNQSWEARRASRLAAIESRIKKDLAMTGEALEKSTRGSPIPIVCRTAYSIDGRRLRFSSTTEAASFAGVSRAHHVQRAIVRNGFAGGHAFAWLNGRIPTDRERQRELKDRASRRRSA